MSDATPPAELVARLDAAEQRLAVQAAHPTPGLTDAEPSTGERWDAGQAWAHLAEFVPYWLGQIERVRASRPDDRTPVPFGRTSSDPGRIGAIEAGRREPPADQMRRLRTALDDVRRAVSALTPDEWAAMGAHPRLGPMSIGRIVERFIVGHLEEHAEQLERLAVADTEANVEGR